MTDETKQCRRCGAEIPAARLHAMPDTRVCVPCSEEIGGEFELEVTVSGTGKAGSLKKTGQDVSVRRTRKPLAPVTE
ncbi:MAG: TraR/DksA C4-type zinc finger protein [Nannocystaceae bacterium]|nr:TraR/DksA C4-type zinc finger protein [Myxococcales bacterium]